MNAGARLKARARGQSSINAVARRFSRAVLLVAAVTTIAAAPAARTGARAATERYFRSIRTSPALLLPFLTAMPKGGDLHNHLSGAIYAESYLQWAAADNLCVATATLAIVAGTCDAAGGTPPAATVVQNAALYGQVIDAMSMRNWNPAQQSGHDHFFATFGKFGPPSGKFGDMLAEVAARAAAEHVSYLELMLTPDGGVSGLKAAQLGWTRATFGDGLPPVDFAPLHRALLAANFGDVVTAATRRLDEAEARERQLLGCGGERPDAGCRVTLRYVSQVSRAAAPPTVFAQMVAGFAIAAHDPRVVSLNLVQPEDAPSALADFRLQMRMLDYLHAQYARVPITLHAGELVEGLVPPEALRFHIAESVRVGHARRIGHGVDVLNEDNPFVLLKEMAATHVAVEIALSSNDLILGVRGRRHPLHAYLDAGVPVALVTDDAGVSRSTMTLEYRKAVEDQALDYETLKRIARNSLEFSFAAPDVKARLLQQFDADVKTFELGVSRQATGRAPSH